MGTTRVPSDGPNAHTSTWSPWWAGKELHNGVFKGGGGKGILYAGALLEMVNQGRWFSAVAGTSAGAITATLIAAGFTATEIADLAAEGPRKVRVFLLGDLGGQPLFRTKALRA